jgi:hypothetical protein
MSNVTPTSKDLLSLLNDAQAFVGKSRCSLGHSVSAVLDNAKAGLCNYCKHQFELYERLGKAFQQLPASAHEPGEVTCPSCGRARFCDPKECGLWWSASLPVPFAWYKRSITGGLCWWQGEESPPKGEWKPLYEHPASAQPPPVGEVAILRNCLGNLYVAVENLGRVPSVPRDADVQFAMREAAHALGPPYSTSTKEPAPSTPERGPYSPDTRDARTPAVGTPAVDGVAYELVVSDDIATHAAKDGTQHNGKSREHCGKCSGLGESCE